ncbi:hypothetical protein BDSB_27795 [Burkholderia dolosa PC543]|nr:hypothetical protein BDSB_27795 [Burkholderia dolosa PC543]
MRSVRGVAPLRPRIAPNDFSPRARGMKETA